MEYSVRCALSTGRFAFWFAKDGSPSATAFLLKQEEINDLPGFQETFEVATTQTQTSKRKQNSASES
jgi:hypothetical protein